MNLELLVSAGDCEVRDDKVLRLLLSDVRSKISHRQQFVGQSFWKFLLWSAEDEVEAVCKARRQFEEWDRDSQNAKMQTMKNNSARPAKSAGQTL
jgi:hypothetical protein